MTNKEEVKQNRFTYTDDQGLKVLSEQEVFELYNKNDINTEDKTINEKSPNQSTDHLMHYSELLKGSTALNDYHQQRSKAACLEVKEMSKRPLSLEQKKEQVRLIKEGIQGKNRKFD